VTTERHELLPPGLRDRVLTASMDARTAGYSFPDVARISPAEAFSRAADAFYALLYALRDDDWQQPVLRGMTVQGLVGHLIGVEHDVHRCLLDDPAVRDVDHIASTRLAAARQTQRRAVETRSEWRHAADHTFALVESANADREVAVHGLRVSLGTLLIIRAFELWTHENDIRGAVGLAASVPDSSTLRLMTALAARALPVGADRLGLHAFTQVRLVLTGTGGGAWDVDFGDAEGAGGPTPIRIVADAADFCRLAANRTTPDQFELHITGDAGRAADVLAAVAALALD
jgi:uncharacterized protein (TIGR03083 family)